MTATLFGFLMVLALGALAGTSIGLCIGYGTGKQKRDWTAMDRKDRTVNTLLVLVFSFACIALLAWYSLL
jgi:hypothetical protein